MQNSMVVFIASVFRLEIPFLGKFGPKNKIVSFSWNVVLSLTEICWIQWWCSLFLFLNGSVFLMVNLFQKTKIICWSWNLETRLIRIRRIRWWFSFYSFLDWKNSFWVYLAQNIKIVSLSWNLVPRLFRMCQIRWSCSFFCFRPFFKFCPKNPFWLWCYLIKLPAVYLQILEANGFSCYF